MEHLPPEHVVEDDQDQQQELQDPPQVVEDVEVDPNSHHHLEDQELIFSEAQLAESLRDHHDEVEDDETHQHHDSLVDDALIVEGDLVVVGHPIMEVDEESSLVQHVQVDEGDTSIHGVGIECEEEEVLHHEGEAEEVDSSLMETTDDGTNMLDTIPEEPSAAEEELEDINGDGELLPMPPPVEVEEEEPEEEEEVEPPCNCPSCLENSDETGHFRGWDPIKAKCLLCYVTISAPQHLHKRLGAVMEEPQSPAVIAGAEISGDDKGGGEVGNVEEALTQKIEEGTGQSIQAEEVVSSVSAVLDPTLPVVTAGFDNNVFGIKSEARDPDAIELNNLTGESGDVEMEHCKSVGFEKMGNNISEETANQIKEILSEKIIHSRCNSEQGDLNEEDDGPLNLDLVFQVLNCSFDDLDQDVDLLLHYIPLCHPCQSVVSDAVVIYKEIQKLENTLGNLRDTIKDQVARSFDTNFCKRKKENEEIEGLVGQIDATRRAILGEDCPAIAKLLNYRKKGRRGRKPGRKKKTVINRSALYPHVTLESGSKKRGRPKKQRDEYDASGVKQEFTSDPEFDEFGDDEQEEEHEVIQTHSGRRVKKPNYKKWLIGDDDDEDERPAPIEPIKAEVVDEEGAASPKSEPDWSPGHSDDEFQDGADSETSSDDSDLGANSDEENDFDDDDDDDDDYRERAPARKRRRSSAGATRIPCPECTRTFADEEKRDRHFQRYHEPGGERHGRRRRGRGGGSLKIHTCDHCDKEFKRPNLLKRHLEKDHGIIPENGDSSDKKKHICEFCGQKYRNGSELRVHVRLHTGETPFKCEHCDQSFVSALKRETHIEQCHWDVPPLKCEFCDRAFFRQHRLRIHRITHTGERAYLCEICSQAFSHPTYLKYHQGQHAELNMESYKCKECGKQFANPTNLKLHVKTVHLKEFRFSCEVCGMGFTHMSHKRIHMRGHTGERPYKCEICGESFRYKDRLRIHLRGHTGERPFVCDVCKKGFASRSKLKRHEKIHEKSLGNRSSQEEVEPQRPLRYSCDDCGKAFAEPQHLSAHKRYCQRKNFPEKEEKPKATKSAPGKIKTNIAPPSSAVPAPIAAPVAAAVQKIQIEHIPAHTIQAQQAQMLVPVTYTYPVTYNYEVAQQYHQQQPPSRDYPNYN